MTRSGARAVDELGAGRPAAGGDDEIGRVTLIATGNAMLDALDAAIGSMELAGAEVLVAIQALSPFTQLAAAVAALQVLATNTAGATDALRRISIAEIEAQTALEAEQLEPDAEPVPGKLTFEFDVRTVLGEMVEDGLLERTTTVDGQEAWVEALKREDERNLQPAAAESPADDDGAGTLAQPPAQDPSDVPMPAEVGDDPEPAA